MNSRTCSSTPAASDQCDPSPALALPHRPDAELAVLGAILQRGSEALSDVADLLDVGDFYQPRAIAVFRAMTALEQSGSPIDAITVEAQLARAGDHDLVGGMSSQLGLDSVLAQLSRLDLHVGFATRQLRAHAELIREAALVRRMVLAGREIAEDGMLNVSDVDEYLAVSERKVLDVRGVTEAPAVEPEPVVEGRPEPLASPKGQERVGRIHTRLEYLTNCTGWVVKAEASAHQWIIARLELVERELAEARRG